jgi:ACS family D-galactonate transporter-like MFS transporter
MSEVPTNHTEAAGVMAMTWPRWRLVGLLMAICFMAHFNRVSMAVAGSMRIMDQYQISPTAMGAVYSAFLASYTLFMIPGGWLIDRRGPRVAMQIVCLGSAVFVLLTGCVGWLAPSGVFAFWAFIAIRPLMGIVSAPLHPAAARAVSLQIPVLRRSSANGLVTGAALLGVAATYLLFGQLIGWLDWPGAFVVAGLATATIGWLWSRYAIEDSITRENVGGSPNKLDLPTGGLQAHERSPTTIRSWARRNKNLLLLTFSYGAVGYFQYLFFYWMNYYFEKILGFGEEQSQFYATFPPLAMAVGMPLGGWLSDRLLARYGWRTARATLAMSAMAASAGLLLLGISTSEPFWIVTWLTLALGVLGAAEGPFWVTAVEVGGRRGGLSASIFNTGGNAGGILAPIVTPWISDALHFGWQSGLAVSSGVCLTGAVLWYWIDVGPTAESDDPQARQSAATDLAIPSAPP